MFDWVLSVIVAGGLLGVAFLMFAENIVPPIPSELVMPLAGFAAAQGHFSLAAVIAAGSVGALAGAAAWYAVGRWLPPRRLERWVAAHGRWLTIDLEDLDKSRRFFSRHGGWAVMAGRLVPGVRTFISVPAGLLRMPAWRFVLSTAAGSTAWTALLAVAGFMLAGQYRKVEAWLDPAASAVMAMLAAIYLWRLWTRRNRQPAPNT